MSQAHKALSILFIALGSFLTAAPVQAEQANPINILFLAVDDLRPELGCYGAQHIRSPHIDGLAREGVRFDHAYCQQALCGPSRASLLTGFRPDASQIHGNHTHFRTFYPHIRTLPQHFKLHGYHTQSMGKIYHGVFPPGSSKTEADTFGDAPSWSVPTYRPGPRYYYTEEGIRAARTSFQRMYGVKNPAPDAWTQKLVFGPMTEAPNVSDSTLYDGKVARRGVQALRELAKKGKPFFLAVGFIKPHTPFVAPRKYWDLYKPSQIRLAPNPEFPDGAPSFAGHNSGEIRRYTDQPKRGPFSSAGQRRLRHGYYACISYIDAQVGLVLDELESLGLEERTVVVLWGDHGFHLGEQNLWGKTTNYELDTRVPLIVRAPGKRGNGQACQAFVELVDLYPTLTELASLPLPNHLQGTSFTPLLDSPDRPWKRFAMSQYTRGNRRGYSLRTRQYRYTEWYDLESETCLDRELYDHRNDPTEGVNIAERPAQQETVARLSSLLRRGDGWSREHERLSRRGSGLSLARPFGDQMVLQRGEGVSIWGNADPGAEVSVDFAAQRKRVTAGADGAWCAELAPLKACATPRDLSVSCKDKTTRVRDVLVGDVWICAGQSNMRWPLEKSTDGSRAAEQSADPGLRLLDLSGRIHPSGKKYSLESLRGITPERFYSTRGWKRCSPQEASRFSGVAYFFGSRLRRELDVPIGLILNAVGGVPIEAYLPPSAYASDPQLKALSEKWHENQDYPAWCRERGRLNMSPWVERPVPPAPRHPFEPGFLFEAGMRPFVPLGIKGFLWYQGESNATVNGAGGPPVDPAMNKRKLVALIKSWREAWDDPELPFYFVQLPGLNRPWPLFREMQLEVAQTVPHTGMAVTIDVGHPTNVHPPNKRPVGERLARLALASTYGKDIASRGPLFRAFEIDGSSLRLSFDHVGGGLRTRDGKGLGGFVLAGPDRAFHPARAEIHGHLVVVSSEKVPRPVAARYAWTDFPVGNLVNEAGLPGSPFRTDRWPERFSSQPRKTVRDARTSFETSPSGRIHRVETEVGIWTAAAGHAEIDARHARTGKKCLHILGGTDRRVEWTPRTDKREARQFSFWAERWTRKSPFRFRVEASCDGKWEEVYRGDDVIRIGGFHTPVKVDLPQGAKRLRFVCTSPPDSGILIDDLVLHEPTPMAVRSVTTSQRVHPVLLGVADNPVLAIDIWTQGSLEPLRVTSILMSTEETQDIADIAEARVFFTGDSERFDTRRPFGKETKPEKSLCFSGDQLLSEGANRFWVSFQLAPGASLDRVVDAGCISVTVGGKEWKPEPTSTARPKRIGIAVRRSGQDGCHTYRIPGLATTNEGTLIAVFDNRYRGGGDLPNSIDVGMCRSRDGGQSWEPMRVIMDMGNENEPGAHGNGIGDPSVLVDRVTGTIWVAASWSHGNRAWRGSGPGLTPDETGQLMLVRSEDDGKTWSKPINITRQVKDPRWRYVLQGPGKGITLRDSTLVFPAQFRGKNEPPVGGKPFSTLIYSKDRGESWHIGAGVKIDTTESQVVQLADGSIMINCRDNRGGSRSVYTTTDLGRTWKVHPTSRSALPEPVCMASLIRVEHERHGAVLFFSNPATARGRHHMTVKASKDEGKTWPGKWHTLCDERFSAYSCMTQIGEDQIGLLYEGEGGLLFLRLSVDELLVR